MKYDNIHFMYNKPTNHMFVEFYFQSIISGYYIIFDGYLSVKDKYGYV